MVRTSPLTWRTKIQERGFRIVVASHNLPTSSKSRKVKVAYTRTASKWQRFQVEPAYIIPLHGGAFSWTAHWACPGMSGHVRGKRVNSYVEDGFSSSVEFEYVVLGLLFPFPNSLLTWQVRLRSLAPTDTDRWSHSLLHPGTMSSILFAKHVCFEHFVS